MENKGSVSQLQEIKDLEELVLQLQNNNMNLVDRKEAYSKWL